MPISTEGYRDRSIPEQALQFRRDGGSLAVSTYQGGLTETIITETIVTVDTTALAQAEQRTATAIQAAATDTEARAIDWHRAFLWTIDANQSLTSGAWSVLGFSTCTVAAPGVYGVASGWAFTVPDSGSGIYHIAANVGFKAVPAQAVLTANLAIFKNGSLYMIIDRKDTGYSGESPMVDILLQGSTLVSCQYGDTITVRVQLNGGVWGPTTFIHPSSAIGYVHGHRVRCDTDIVDTPDPQTGFTLGT